VDERLSSAGLFGESGIVTGLAISGESLYTRSLAALQFGTHEAILTGAGSHYFAEKRRTDLPADMIKAVFRDLSSLQTSLPLTDSSSVFFRYDDENVGLAQAMITGPENTPYANGCFLFDILFPDHYPQVPPQVNSRTNGGGTVRFNPNLYDNGKVCLSLLGTWSGERGESWNHATSTLLQVLVSIQSLILIDDPYFNEPGYESTKGTKEGDKKSADYNINIRGYTIKWAMLEQLKHPPPAFTAVVKNHFRLKREAIRIQLNDWQMGNSHVKDTVKQTLAELDKLT